MNIKQEQTLTIKELAELLNVHVVTIRNWEREGKSPIPVHRTVGNQRRYLLTDVNKYLGLENRKENKLEKDSKKTIIYARVSSRDQKKDLDTQIQLLSLFATSKGFQFEIFSEIFSGMNFKRPKFNQLLEMVENGEVERIIINHKDRLLRFGYDMFEKICKLNNVEILVLDESKKELQQELLEDFISLITSFSGKIYGKRSHKNKELIKLLRC